MKPRQVLGKYFEVYGQGSPITPEAGKKGLLFIFSFSEEEICHEGIKQTQTDCYSLE